MAKVILDMSRCKGCFLCASVCPKGVLTPSKELSAKGFGLIHLNEDKECIAAGPAISYVPTTASRSQNNKEGENNGKSFDHGQRSPG